MIIPHNLINESTIGKVDPLTIGFLSSNTTEKIQNCILEIFEALKNVGRIPFRYIGSKTWSIPGLVLKSISILFDRVLNRQHLTTNLKEYFFGAGYHFFMQKKLNHVEIIPYFPHAGAINAVHASDHSWIEPLGYETIEPKSLNLKLKDSFEGLQPNQKCFFDERTGLKITTFIKDKEVIFTIGTVGSSRSEIQDSKVHRKIMWQMAGDAIYNFLGGNPTLYRQADQFIQSVMQNPFFSDKKISLTGHCFGASVAAYLGIKHQIKTICFNSFPIGAGLQMDIGPAKLDQSDDFVTHITARNDYTSDFPFIHFIDLPLSLIGIRTPGNFGKRYYIPSAYHSTYWSSIVHPIKNFHNFHNTHRFILGSMMKCIGQDRKTKIQDIVTTLFQKNIERI